MGSLWQVRGLHAQRLWRLHQLCRQGQIRRLGRQEAELRQTAMPADECQQRRGAASAVESGQARRTAGATRAGRCLLGRGRWVRRQTQPRPSNMPAPLRKALTGRIPSRERMLCRITKLNGSTSPSSPDRYDDDGYDSEENSPRLQRPEPGGVASDFCFKLASVLVRILPGPARCPLLALPHPGPHLVPPSLRPQAADGSLSSQPIALRALQQAGILEASVLQNLAAPRTD